MRTNIVLDEELVKEAFKYSSAQTKRELVREALTFYLENKKRKNLLDLFGKIDFANGYDYKKLRANR